MADAQRLKVDHLIIHHAVTPMYENKSDSEIRDIFDRFGRAIYNYGTSAYIHPGHYRPDNGAVTHAQVQYALHPYTADGNKYGYRLVDLMKDPFGSLTWGAGNWNVNQRAVQIEFCMDARNQMYDDKAFMLVADHFRAYDKSIGGALNVFGHQQVSQLGTACPANLMGKLEMLIDMINNPDKWNAKLWPKPVDPPKPPVTPPAPSKSKYVKYSTVKRFKVTNAAGAELWNLDAKTWGEFKSQKHFNTGDTIDVAGYAEHPLGGNYIMTPYSFGKANETGSPAHDTGINQKDVAEVPIPAPEPPKPTQPPVDPPKPVEPPVTPTPTTPPAPSRDDTQDVEIGALKAAMGGIFALFKSIGDAIAEFLKLKK